MNSKEALNRMVTMCVAKDFNPNEVTLENSIKTINKDLDKLNIFKNNVIKFIKELAWQDVKYDAFESTMGEFPASPSAIPRYAKKYFDLWKEMFKEDLEKEE